MGKTSKNFSGCCVYLCFLVHFHPFSQFFFATLKPSSETKAAGPWRHVGVTKALSCDCPSALEKKEVL